jgi:hypothetical protein
VIAWDGDPARRLSLLLLPVRIRAAWVVRQIQLQVNAACVPRELSEATVQIEPDGFHPVTVRLDPKARQTALAGNAYQVHHQRTADSLPPIGTRHGHPHDSAAVPLFDHHATSTKQPSSGLGDKKRVSGRDVVRRDILQISVAGLI